MLRSSPLDPEVWHQWLRFMDLGVASAVDTYVKKYPETKRLLHKSRLRLTADLKEGCKPIYSDRSTVLAYAFEYMVRRAASVVGAMRHLPSSTHVRRVLDVGSGSGACSLAVGVLSNCWQWSSTPPSESDPIIVAHMEPAGAMHDFSLGLPLVPELCRAPAAGRWEDLQSPPTENREGYFDLAICSAALPHDAWDASSCEEIASGLVARVRPRGHILLIEPWAKGRELDTLVRYLMRTREVDAPFGPFTSRGYDEPITTKRALPRLSSLYRELTGVRFESASWNDTRDDLVRILQRQPES